MTATEHNFLPNMLTGVAAGALFLMLTGVVFSAEVPRLDVASACKAAAGADLGIKYDSDQCMKSENDARDQLAAKWTSFPAADRDLCTKTATMGGSSSYVELITCLEMKQAVANTPPDLGLYSRPSSLRTKP